MTSVEIVSVIFMLGMMAFIFPRAKHMLKNSPKGSMQDWMGFAVPMLAIVGFIALLIAIV